MLFLHRLCCTVALLFVCGAAVLCTANAEDATISAAPGQSAVHNGDGGEENKEEDNKKAIIELKDVIKGAIENTKKVVATAIEVEEEAGKTKAGANKFLAEFDKMRTDLGGNGNGAYTKLKSCADNVQKDSDKFVEKTGSATQKAMAARQKVKDIETDLENIEKNTDKASQKTAVDTALESAKKASEEAKAAFKEVRKLSPAAQGAQDALQDCGKTIQIVKFLADVNKVRQSAKTLAGIVEPLKAESDELLQSAKDTANGFETTPMQIVKPMRRVEIAADSVSTAFGEIKKAEQEIQNYKTNCERAVDEFVKKDEVFEMQLEEAKTAAAGAQSELKKAQEKEKELVASLEELQNRASELRQMAKQLRKEEAAATTTKTRHVGANTPATDEKTKPPHTDTKITPEGGAAQTNGEKAPVQSDAANAGTKEEKNGTQKATQKENSGADKTTGAANDGVAPFAVLRVGVAPVILALLATVLF